MVPSEAFILAMENSDKVEFPMGSWYMYDQNFNVDNIKLTERSQWVQVKQC